jgi:hypothetical protein
MEEESMALNLADGIKRALRDERNVMRPYFFASSEAEPGELVAEETYLRLRLARMFLKYRRELFQTKYPVVNAAMRFAGLDGMVEVNFVVQPQMAGGSHRRLADIVTLDQTLLGPVLYRGGDLELTLSLYAAPADDWAQRFIRLAEGISLLSLNTTLATAISMAGTIKTSVEGALESDGLDLKLGLNTELKERVWLRPGYLVLIAAVDADINADNLTVVDGDLWTRDGGIYTAHDYIVLTIEVSGQRSDWQALGYGNLWQKLLKTAAEADDIQAVKDNYATFSGAILASPDLSWPDRSAIVRLAQQRIKAIRDARSGVEFFEGIKGMDTFLQIESLIAEVPVLLSSVGTSQTAADLLETNWIE